eukprot:127153-Prorocentrum_minimum.AAC.1
MLIQDGALQHAGGGAAEVRGGEGNARGPPLDPLWTPSGIPRGDPRGPLGDGAGGGCPGEPAGAAGGTGGAAQPLDGRQRGHARDDRRLRRHHAHPARGPGGSGAPDIPEGVQRGSRGRGPEGVQRGSRGGPEGVHRVQLICCTYLIA